MSVSQPSSWRASILADTPDHSRQTTCATCTCTCTRPHGRASLSPDGITKGTNLRQHDCMWLHPHVGLVLSRLTESLLDLLLLLVRLSWRLLLPCVLEASGAASRAAAALLHHCCCCGWSRSVALFLLLLLLPGGVAGASRAGRGCCYCYCHRRAYMCTISLYSESRGRSRGRSRGTRGRRGRRGNVEVRS